MFDDTAGSPSSPQKSRNDIPPHGAMASTHPPADPQVPWHPIGQPWSTHGAPGDIGPASGSLNVPTLTLAVVTTFHTALAKTADAQTKVPQRGIGFCSWQLLMIFDDDFAIIHSFFVQ